MLTNKLKDVRTTQLIFTTIIFLIPFHLTPYLILGTDAYLYIEDNLDSEFVYLHLLKINNLLFKYEGTLTNVMNGLPLHFIHPEKNFLRVIFYIFPSFWAYVVNSIIVRIIGFIGMFLLLKDYIIKENRLFQFLIAITFSLIAIYPIYGISIMGQPILLWSFLNLIHNKKITISYIIIFLSPFYMAIQLTAPFFLLAISIIGVYKYKLKLFKTKFFLGITLLTLGFIIANFNLIYGFITGKYISHRKHFNFIFYSQQISKGIFLIKKYVKTIIYTSIFARLTKLNTLPIHLTNVLSIILSKNKRALLVTLEIIILSLLLLTSNFLYSFYLFQKLFKISEFSVSRIIFLLPILMFTSFSLSINNLLGKIDYKVLLAITIALLISVICYNDEIYINYKKTLFKHFAPEKYKQITYYAPGFREFYSTNVFHKIDSIIGKPKNTYRTISIGLVSSIAQYNGFYTLDSYQNNYPLSYKLKFRKVIEKELEKNEDIKNFFDNWGSMCYVFSADIREKTGTFMKYSKENKDTISIALNIPALKELADNKPVYIFSTAYIKNYKELNLEFIDYIYHPKDLYAIYLYKVK